MGEGYCVSTFVIKIIKATSLIALIETKESSLYILTKATQGHFGIHEFWTPAPPPPHPHHFCKYSLSAYYSISRRFRPF